MRPYRGVVDQNIDAAEIFLDGLDHTPQRADVRQISLVHARPAAVSGNLLAECPRRFVIVTKEDDRNGPGFGHGRRNAAPDVFCASGNQSDFSRYPIGLVAVLLIHLVISSKKTLIYRPGRSVVPRQAAA